MADPKILTVLLNYKTAEMTLKAAEAALRELEPLQGELVIVDNDSQDGSFEALTEAAEAKGWLKGGRTRVVQSGHNGGFGAGNNVGFRAGLSDGTAPDYLYVLNSDAFPDPGSIKALLDYLEANPKTGFAGSYIYGEDGEAHRTTFRYPSVLSELEGAAQFGPISRLLKNHIISLPVPEQTCDVDWLAGASLMMRQKVLDEIGHFDETFFLYFEETDLCRRATQAGWRIAYVRASSVMHIGSVSTGMKKWERIPGYWLDSRLHYFTKNHGGFAAFGATLAQIAGGSIAGLRRLIQKRQATTPKAFLRDLVAHDMAALFRKLGLSRNKAASGMAAPAKRKV